MSLYLYLPEAAKAALPNRALDRVLDFLELLLIEHKFYTIFSVLFGVGFAVILTRAQAKGLVFHRFYLRRVAGLFAIGFAHAILFWHNDIVAFCGALIRSGGRGEWLWRMLTYGEWLPLGRRAVA